MSRFASSVSLTITVAAATLVAMTAILAGPTLVDCSHAGGGIAACFRARVIESGILPGNDEPSVPIEISSEPSSSSEAPSIVASVEPTRPGWLDAAAAELPVEALAPVALTPAPGEIDAVSDAALGPEPIEVALAPVPGEIIAVSEAVPEPEPIKIALAQDPGRIEDIPAMPPALPSVAVNLSAPAITGRIEVAMAAPVPTVLSGDLSPPPGRIALSTEPVTGQGVMSETSLAPDPAPTGSIVAEARLGTGGQGTGWTELTFTPVPAEPQGTIIPPPMDTLPAPPIPVVTLEPQPDPEFEAAPADPPVEPAVPPAQPEKPARPSPPARPAPPVRILTNDPRYPSVTIMPPPNTGAASSFMTLTLSP